MVRQIPFESAFPAHAPSDHGAPSPANNPLVFRSMHGVHRAPLQQRRLIFRAGSHSPRLVSGDWSAPARSWLGPTFLVGSALPYVLFRVRTPVLPLLPQPGAEVTSFNSFPVLMPTKVQGKAGCCDALPSFERGSGDAEGLGCGQGSSGAVPWQHRHRIPLALCSQACGTTVVPCRSQQACWLRAGSALQRSQTPTKPNATSKQKQLQPS